ncbi:MAG: DsbA family protein [Actinomycetota bacterium]
MSDTADLEFFFDPVCPWAWVTSRWVHHVRDQRDYQVVWRPISLWVINEENTAEWYTPEYREGHYFGHRGLRIADALRTGESDASAVGHWYTTLGTAIHTDGRRGEAREDADGFLTQILADAGFDGGYLAAADDDSRDAAIRASSAEAFSRTGDGVGTPILTFHPGTEREASFFGPVISKAPRGDEALQLWDAVETLATMSGMAELKRSNRHQLDFT